MALAGSANAQPLQPAAFLALSASVVRVEAEGSHPGLSLGSGVVVGPGVVVTNCHVTRAAHQVRVSSNGTISEATA